MAISYRTVFRTLGRWFGPVSGVILYVVILAYGAQLLQLLWDLESDQLWVQVTAKGVTVFVSVLLLVLGQLVCVDAWAMIISGDSAYGKVEEEDEG